MATQVLSPARGVMVTVFAMMLTWLDVVGYFQSVCWLCGRVGVIKALAFSMVLRFHFLPPWDDASQTMKWAATDTDEFYLFEPTLEQMSPTLNHGFLFIPGALVHPHSYAPVLSRLANASKGQVLCVCVKPRFRHPALWADSEERALTIISEMMRRYPSVTSWTIGGHSMGAGGYGAARIVSRLLARGAPVRGLVMWAGAITNGTGVDLKAAQLRSLVLLASEDSVVPPHGKVEDGSNTQDNLRRYHPPGTKVVVIEGGNHGGFGNYGPQTFPRLDNPRTISLEEQQSQAVDHTARFLRDVIRRA